MGNRNGTEDTQPNELRSDKKGHAAVPTIRPTHTTPRHFLDGSNYHYAGHYRNVNRSIRGGHNSFLSSSVHGEYFARRPPGTGHSPLQKRPPSGNITTSERPNQRPRLNSRKSSLFPKQPSSSTHTIGDMRPSPTKQELPSIDYVEIVIPVWCRKGEPDNNRLRGQWLKREVLRIEQELYATVLNHHFMGDHTVRFSIRKLRPNPESDGPDTYASVPRGSWPTSSSGKICENVKHERSPVSLFPVKSEQSDADMPPWEQVSPSIARDVDVARDAEKSSAQSAGPHISLNSLSASGKPIKRLIDFTSLLERSQHLDRRRNTTQISASVHNQTNGTFKESDRSHDIAAGTSTLDIVPVPSQIRRTDFVASSATSDPKKVTLSSLQDSFDLPGIDVLFNEDDNSEIELDNDIRILPSDASDVDELQEVVCVPKEVRDRPRRLLTGCGLGLLSLTMKGALNVVSRNTPRKQWSLWSLLSGRDASGEIIDDACLMDEGRDPWLILGGPSKSESIVILPFEGHKMGKTSVLCRPRQEKKKSGVSVVCSFPRSRSFVTGGYDHCVHLWTVPSREVSAITCQSLAIKHASMIQALLPLYDTSQKLLSGGADCTVNLLDLSSEMTLSSFKTSTSIFHIHQVLSESCIILEVAHRELQFELRDIRSNPKKTVQRFGFNANKLNRRHWKGDVHSTQLASGDHDGVVRVWDMRKAEQPLSTTTCFPGRRITQVVFDHNKLAVCSGDHHIAFLDV